MIKSGNDFCAKCGSNLSGGKACGCNASPKDFDRTVLVKAVFCVNCNRELYVDEKCNCEAIHINNFCKECGKKLYGNKKCDCQGKPVTAVALEKTAVKNVAVKNVAAKNVAETKKSGLFKKAGEL